MWPTLRIAHIVNHGQNMNKIMLDCVENAVWKPWQEGAAHARHNFRVQERKLLNALKLKFKSQLKFRAEPFALILIPIERFADFVSRPTGKLQAVRHEPLFKCAFT